MVILGIDPGTANTGYGVINELACLEYGLVKTDLSLTTAERLKKLHDGINDLIEKYQPEILAIEKLYFFKNVKTVLPVSQAKGVILLSAAKYNIPVLEYTPLQVKQATTGYGKAEKMQVQQMVKLLLKLKEIPKPDDAADALAVAICCAHSKK